MNFQPMPVGFEPGPDITVLVVRGVVLNQNGPLPAISPRQLFQETEVGSGIEDRILAIIKRVRQNSMAPKILTFLRSPVTAISGARPTRLQVAWSVESCRKLASSVKMSAQFRARAFF